MHTTLITGINGFVGHHLARAMKEAGCTVWGNGRAEHPDEDLAPYVDHYVAGDLVDRTVVDGLPLDKLDSIINLAGLANVGASFDNPALYHKVNVEIIKNLGDALLDHNLTKVRLVAISTGAVYDPTQPPPFTEASRLVHPKETSPYVASKLAMEKAALDLQAKGLSVTILRPFNHTGPGQKAGFLLPDLAEQIVRAKAQRQDTIQVGNLANLRDFTDVRDIAQAYRKVAMSSSAKLNGKIYNVCSGTPLSGLQILDLLTKELGADYMGAEVDQSRIRPSDPPVLYGNHQALSDDTSWHPVIAIEQTVKDFVASL